MLIVEDTLKNITEENKRNDKELITLVQRDIEHRLAVKTFVSGVKAVKGIADFAGTFKGVIS